MIGRVIHDRYRLDRIVGEGASGVVYSGFDLTLGRRVAVKMLNGRAQGQRDISDLLKEAQKMAALNHPNIVQIYDCGFHESSPYIVMEFVEGKPLREILAGPRLSLERGLELMRQVAAGLEEVHKRSIVHRDLSANNIIVTDGGNAKLLDLGLAKDLSGISSTIGEGYLVGTIAYISPEQIEGRTVTTASDVFSFGTLLYEIVTGAHPFHAEHYMSMLYNITNREPTPLETWLENPPPRLAALIRDCLEKDPAGRPAGMGEVARLLQTIGTSEEMTASHRKTPEAIQPPSQGNPYHNRAMIRKRDDFYGRRQDVRRIFARINATPPGSVSVVGDRKIGKSSLLNHIYLRQNRESYLERPEKVVMLFLDFQEQKDATLDSFVRVMLKTAQMELRGRLEVTDFTSDLEGIKAFIQRLDENGFRLVMMMDEFECITANPNFELEFFSFLRFLANRYNVAYLTSSTKDLQLLCHTKEIKDSPFFNIFQTMRLSVFKREEARELIEVPSERIGKPLAAHADQLIQMAGLFPFFLQIACYHAIDYLEENPGASLDLVEVQRRFYNEVRLHFRWLWNTFDTYEKSAINRVAAGRKIPSALEHVLQELGERHLVETEPAPPRLFSGSFENFVRQETSIDARNSLFGWLRGKSLRPN